MLSNLTDNEVFEFLIKKFEPFGFGRDSIQQHPLEAIWFLQLARLYMRKRCQRIVEIGSYLGGNLCLLSRLCADNGELISIEPNLYRATLQTDFVNELIYPIKLIHIKKRSNDPTILLSLNNPIDILFIDGSHIYDDVKFDYETFSPLVGSPGLVVLHDISQSTCGAVTYWKELSQLVISVEKITYPGTRGMGVCLF